MKRKRRYRYERRYFGYKLYLSSNYNDSRKVPRSHKSFAVQYFVWNESQFRSHLRQKKKTNKPIKCTFAKTPPTSSSSNAHQFYWSVREETNLLLSSLHIHIFAEAFLGGKGQLISPDFPDVFPLRRLPFRLGSTVTESFKGFHGNWRLLRTPRDSV